MTSLWKTPLILEKNWQRKESNNMGGSRANRSSGKQKESFQTTASIHGREMKVGGTYNFYNLHNSKLISYDKATNTFKFFNSRIPSRISKDHTFIINDHNKASFSFLD
jgi:hypothetical protein